MGAHDAAPILSEGLRDALEGWSAHLASVDGRAPSTVSGYLADARAFLTFMAGHMDGARGPSPLRDAGSWKGRPGSREPQRHQVT